MLGVDLKTICYSGFRKGQHPDRGESAVHPSEAEILRDQTRAKELDFVSFQCDPIWKGKRIDQDTEFGVANVQAVRNALPDNRLVITETGWVTVADEFGLRVDEEKQKPYFADLFAWAEAMNITTFFFKAFDDSWKGDPKNPRGAEKHRGIFTEDRKTKRVMEDLYPDLSPE